MPKKNKKLNLVKEDQVVVFRAARRGRTGGQFTASTMEELSKLASDAGWSGDVKVTQLFVTKPVIKTVGENNEKV